MISANNNANTPVVNQINSLSIKIHCKLTNAFKCNFQCLVAIGYNVNNFHTLTIFVFKKQLEQHINIPYHLK